MSELDKSGTLSEFNLHNLDRRTYELVENIIAVLELQNSENHEYVKNKLDEKAQNEVMEFIEKNKINPAQ